ncbi:hypothetical protein [Bartonella sp. AP88XZML]|uniref:hypothetical protein n=1 Tax=Bartonella sp. AP88XZML TaxID=3243506 RepID=UPI0035CFCE7D
MSQGEDKAIVEDSGGVYEWCRITFFIETMVVIEFIVRGYIYGGAIVIPFMGAVHEMEVDAHWFGSVERCFFLNRYVNW